MSEAHQHPTMQRETFVEKAAKTKPTLLGWLFVACLAIIMVMGTIKIGLIWFT